ncbi:hypothetical protein [uncultured Imperialibacter sp.]|uniref:beta strand repeat-containing protein n=1 Tax=uncultured Imperialibacter sp. TaxID=1672639 RepID=UPI0030D98B18
MKFKILVFSIVLVGAIQNLYAQNSVGIGTETPNQNAVLELIAINGNQGFLAPRLTAAERTAFAANLTATDNGMLVFDSDDGTLYVWYNSTWNVIGLSQLVAGNGISISGQEITNSGDIDATDDVTITTASAGDVLGRFDSLVVSGLKGLPLDSIAPSTGFSLVWNGSLWKFALDSASNQTVIPNANLLATNTQAALEELQVEILSITSGPNSISSSEIIDGSIADADINATADIAGTKVNPDFGSQNVLTTGTVTAASFSGDGSGLTNIPATPGPNTVGSPELIDGSIADADINAAAAIAGTKVTPNFGAQNISTTGLVTASSFSGDGSGLTNIPATPGPNTVSSAEVVDGSIAFSDLNTAVVDGVTLASNGSSFEVRDNGVTTAKLVNGSVTDAKVSDVAPAKITQSGATTGQVLKWTGSTWAPATDVTGLASLTSGTLLIGDGTNTPQEQVITGHITVDNTGIAQIQSAVITHDMVNDLSFVDGITLVSNGSTFEVPAGGISSLEILDGTISDIDISDVDAGKIIGLGTAATLNVGTGASNIVQLDGTGALPAIDGSNLIGVVPVIGAGTIGATELAANAVTNGKIADGNVTGAKIATDAISSDKIVDGSVITIDLADGNVTTAKLANNAVTGVKIADGSIADADIADVAVGKVTGLGTAATLDAGVTTNDLVQLPSDGMLPALDGSALVNMSAAQISGLGTAASLNAGTAANNVIQLDGTGALPAVDGSALTGITVAGFTGPLAGDVTGTQGATVVGQVGGVTATNVALGANAANTATALNTSGTIVARDGSGNFAANNITATSFAGDGAAITGLDANAINDMEVNATDNVVSLGAGGGKTAAQGGSAGTDNTFLGANAGQATSGNGNTFVGSNAGLANTSGAHNIFIGGDGGTNTTGNFNTLIGDNADVGVDGLTNATAIGANAVVSTDNSIVLGSGGVKVGIGTSSPVSGLQIFDDYHLFHFDNGSTVDGEFLSENLYPDEGANLMKYTNTGPASAIYQHAGNIQFLIGSSQPAETDALTGVVQSALVLDNAGDAQFGGAVEVGDVKGTPTSGMIRYNGNFEGFDGVSWNSFSSLAYPVTDIVADGGTLIDIVNTGGGGAASFSINNTSAISSAVSIFNDSDDTGSNGLSVSHTGLGGGAEVIIGNGLNNQYGLLVETVGTNSAGRFQVNNVSNTAAALSSEVIAGAGAGLEVTTSGDGYVANFRNLNASNSVPALIVGNDGTDQVAIFQNTGNATAPAVTINNSGTGAALEIQSGNTSRIGQDASFGGLVSIGHFAPGVSLDIAGNDAIRIPSGTTAQRPTPVVGMIRYNTTLGTYEGYDGSAWQDMASQGITGALTQDLQFDGATNRTIQVNAALSGVGSDLILKSGDGATNSDVGGDIVLSPGVQPGFLTPSDVIVNGAMRLNGPSGSPVAFANGDFQFETGGNRNLRVGTVPSGAGNNLSIQAGGTSGGTGGNLGLNAGTGTVSAGYISMSGTNLIYGASDLTHKVEFTDGTAAGSVYNMLSLTNNNTSGTGTGVALSFRGSTNGSNRFDLGKISAAKSSPTAGGMKLSVLTNTAGPTYVDAININGLGRVGIGNPTPAEALDVTGNIQASGTVDAADFTFSSAVTRYASYSANVFDVLTMLGSDTKFATPNAVTGYHYFNGVSGALGYAVASMNLPDGAVITELAGWVWDNDATSPSRIELVRHENGTSNYLVMATVESDVPTALASVQSVSTVSVFSGAIDNSLYSYFVRYTGKDDNTQNTRLYNARIQYQITKPY